MFSCGGYSSCLRHGGETLYLFGVSAGLRGVIFFTFRLLLSLKVENRSFPHLHTKDLGSVIGQNIPNYWNDTSVLYMPPSVHGMFSFILFCVI